MTNTMPDSASTAKPPSPKKTYPSKNIQKVIFAKTATTPEFSMNSADFTEFLQRSGLWQNNIGIDGLKDLGKLIESPVPMVARNKGKTPSPLKCLSLLIAKGHAKLNEARTQYEVTDLGRKWHAAVTAALKGAK